MRLHRNDHLIHRRQRIERQKSEARRAIQNDVIKAIEKWLQSAPKKIIPLGEACKLGFRRCKIDGRGDDPEFLANLNQGILNVGLRIDQQVVDRGSNRLAVDTNMQREMSLWIEIDREYPSTFFRDPRGQITACRGLPHSTFLIQ